MTNNKQQTAVEWLWEIAYNRELTVEDWKQAKEMEKERIIKAWKAGDGKYDKVADKLSEQYYNETFGDNNDENDI
jgi:hypothetical protein